MNTKQLLILILLCALPLLARAQSSDDRTYANIEPPTVASLTKYIDNPVGLFYGNPEISHTLYTLKDGAIALPITLQYNTSGIKVMEEASWVGLGWNLAVGGVIVQHAVGMLDEKSDYDISYTSSYPNGSFPAYMNLVYPLGDKGRYTDYYTKATESRLQPDVFSFSFPEGNGKFYIDYHDDSIHLLDASRPLDIAHPSEDCFQITTEDGTQHTFDTFTDVWQDGNGPLIRISRIFVLDSTVYPNGQRVNYTYEGYDCISFHRVETGEHIVRKCGSLVANMNCGIPPTVTTYRITSKEPILKSITTDNYAVEFKTSTRTDFPGSLKLDAMVIKALSAASWNSPERKICFEYSYFTSSTEGKTWLSTQQDTSGFFESNHLNKRLKLDAVYEADISGTQNNRLSFDYYNPTGLPPKNSFAVDYWGYYNGQTTNSYLIPDFNNLHWKQNTYAKQHQGSYVGNRACNPESMQNGLLRSVQYPTGGLTLFIYEPHEYQSTDFIPTCDEIKQLSMDEASPILSLRKRNASTDVPTGWFNVDAGDEIKIQFYFSKGQNAWSDLESIGYALLFTPTGGTMETYHAERFNVNNLTASYSKPSYSFTAEKTGRFQFILTFPESLGDQSEMQSGHADFTADVYKTDTSLKRRGYSRGGGMRVKAVNIFESTNTSVPPVLSYAYSYPADGGVLFTPLAFQRTYERLHYYQAKSVNGHENVNYGSDGIEMTLSSSNFHSAPYSTVGSAVCYPKVTVQKKHFNDSQGSVVHTFNVSREISTTCSYQLPEVGSGKPLAIEYYDDAGKLLKSESYHYAVSLLHFYSGVTVTDYFNRSPKFYNTDGYYLVRMSGGAIYDDYFGRYMSLVYGIKSQCCLPESKTLYQDGVTTHITYDYDDHCQLKKETVTGSDGTVRTTCYSYPYDFSFTPYTVMAAKHQWSYPVETKTLVNGKLCNSQLTCYGLFGEHFYPASQLKGRFDTPIDNTTTFTAAGPSPIYYPRTDITYLKYDAQGNPVHLNVKGEEIVYIWGYNYQYPVAQIRNSSYTKVKEALGCTPESLSSTMIPPASIETLRTKLPSAHINTYTYIPLQGMRTQTVPNQNQNGYAYDGFGRLVEMTDSDGKSLEKYDYHYRD